MKARLIIVITVLLSVPIILITARGYYGTWEERHCPGCQKPDQKQEYGVIEGVVVDKNNQPMPYMLVRAERKSGHIGELPEATTDKKGKFIIHGIPIGTHNVYAGKDAEGYPKMLGSFWLNEEQVQTVVVDKGSISVVKIVLGERLGRIIGVIRDVNGRKLKARPTVRLTVAIDPKRWYQKLAEEDGSFLAVVPSDSLMLEASAEGYVTFRINKLTVGPSSIKKLRIHLSPTGGKLR